MILQLYHHQEDTIPCADWQMPMVVILKGGLLFFAYCGVHVIVGACDCDW